MLAWVCEEFPLFARDLPHRKLLDRGAYRDFSFDCKQTIHASRWALSGEAGRFTDPLYSPGSDFIAIHNTLICYAIMTRDTKELAAKCHLYELLMQSLYASLIPTFATSYSALGHQVAFVLKYTWELSVYFTFFVFPFINDLFTNRPFILSFLSRFSRLGPLNRGLQSYLSAYYEWKKRQPESDHEPMHHDLASLEPLRRAEGLFYKVGVTVDEARELLDEQQDNLSELARFIVAYINADVSGDPDALMNRALVENVDLRHLRFNADAIREQHARCSGSPARYEWSFDSRALDQFRGTRHDAAGEAVAESAP